MIKAIIFDLDGTLYSSKDLHYNTFNQALVKNNYHPLSYEEHITTYDGLSTKEKLLKLNISNSSINSDKQFFTQQALLASVKPDVNLKLNLEALAKDFQLAVCSNAVRQTIEVILEKLEISHLFQFVFSNEDVKHPKPHSEIYTRAILKFNLNPQEVLIVEDNPNGLTSAYNSGAHVYRVSGPEDIDYSSITSFIDTLEPKTYSWQDSKLDVVILAAGAGSRFKSAGYTLPKPLIDVNGKPMIQRVIENLNVQANYFFLIQDNQTELATLLKTLVPASKTILVPGLTEGAASTSLLAKPFLNESNKLLLVNSDQILNWNSSEFFYKMQCVDPDACAITFHDPTKNPKWSFCKVEANKVTQVAEKNPISDIANTGLFYFKNSKSFFTYLNRMINKNIRVNNEFYIAPVMNELIEDSNYVINYNIKEFHGLGTPDDLIKYLGNNK
jgi:HAD superfamily hydrolase (TIGR01509 family)